MSLRRIFGLLLLFLFFEAAIAVLATFFTPDIHIFVACAAMTALAVAVWAIYILVMRISMRPRIAVPIPPAPFAPRPATAAPPAATADVRNLIAEANRRLAASPFASTLRTKPTITNYPLYLVAGPQGTGKTSVILHSGIDPQLLAGQCYQDSAVIPTKIVNLWFAKNHIFADVGGKVFADEPDTWRELIEQLSGRSPVPKWKQLLGRRLPGPNLAGVILVCEVKGFLRTSDPQKTAVLTRKIQERLQSVSGILGAEFPVYALFTKSDAIPYFGDFFAHLSEKEETKPLGATLGRSPAVAADSDGDNKRIARYFNRLYAALASKRLAMLARESSVAKKPGIYEFPRELKRLRSEIVRFLADAFRPNPIAATPWLRGFYFSGTRKAEGEAQSAESLSDASILQTNINATVYFSPRTAPSVATSASVVRPQAPLLKWAFLPDLFNGTILRDKAAARTVASPHGAGLYETAGLAAAAVFFLVLAVAWAVSWSNNRTLMNQAEAAIANLSNVAGTAPPSIESLRRLEDARPVLAQLARHLREGAPLSLRWGLYSGNRVFEPLAMLYIDKFQKLFLAPAADSLANRFALLDSSAPSASYDEVYDQVKTYRMITSGACSRDKNLLAQQLRGLVPWTSSLPPDGATMANRQIDFYVSDLMDEPPARHIPEKGAAVHQAQAYLSNFKGPERVLRGLTEQVDRERGPVSLSQYSSNYRDVLQGPDSVEGAYTREGWEAIRKHLRENRLGSSGDSCVSGEAAVASTFAGLGAGEAERNIEGLYIKAYIEKWKQFLAAQHIAPFHGFPDAKRKLDILSDNRSPLFAVLYMVSRNTSLPQEPVSAQEQLLEKGKQGLRSFFGSKGKAGKAAKEAVDAHAGASNETWADVKRAFEPAQRVVDPGSSERLLNDANRGYINALASLGDAIAGLGANSDSLTNQSGWDRAFGAANQARSNARQIAQSFDSTPEQVDVEVKRLLEEPIADVQTLLGADPSQHLAGEANKQAQRLCGAFEPLRRKFPFNPNASEEVSLDELTRFFVPGAGQLTQVTLQPPLGTVVQRQGTIWMQNPAGAPVKLLPRFLQSLGTLSQFSDLLFANGAQPHIDYEVSLSATGPIDAELGIDGRTIKCSGSSRASLRASWPGAGSGIARLTVISDRLTLPIEETGSWAIFRLLADANEQLGNAFVFSKLRFGGKDIQLQDASGQPAAIRIEIDSPNAAIFSPGYLARVQCAGKAVQ